MRKGVPLFSTLMLIAFSAAAADDLSWPAVKSSIETQYPGVRHITTKALSDWLADNGRRQPTLLDIREQKEYDVSHLKGAKLAPTKSAALAHLKDVPRDHPIVVYCSVGMRSASMAKALSKAGFTAVFNLEGSIFQWRNEGRPVYSGGKSVSKVHPYDERWGRLLDSRYH